jgi:1-acyl-sn-glycerol-3-phosphate acyltransferase
MALWISQVARVMSDHCLRIFAVLHTAAAGGGQRDAAWHVVVALWVLPSIFLSPINGAIANSLPKPRVLRGTALFCLAVILIFGLVGGGWLGCVALLAIGSAVYGPTRYALLPAAAQDCGLPLSRVNGWIEMGTATAIVAGMVLGGSLYGAGGAAPETRFAAVAEWAPSLRALGGMPAAVVAALGMSVVAWLALWPVAFRADVRRAESGLAALSGFFRDAGRIWRRPETRDLLLGLAGVRALGAAVAGAAIAQALSQADGAAADSAFQALLRVAVWTMVGAAAGSLLAGVQGHPRRALGLVPIASTGLLIALLCSIGYALPWWLYVIVGVMIGLVHVPLSAAYQAAVPADARGNAMAVLSTTGFVFMTIMSLLIAGLARFQVISATGQMVLVAAVAALGTMAAWLAFARDSLEQALEIVLWPIYRIHGRGPGLARLPRTGPLLVVANHTCWFDPLWLAKVLPRRLTPMMTSMFFDLPGLHWLMVHVVHAIRVPVAFYRREAPELAEAVAALDRGACVVIFPEGRLRRTADKMLRRFGQGVYHILQERPATPVVLCWIEGGWGSFASYAGGPPTVNKRMDFWRRIDVGVSEPLVVDPVLLEDQQATRRYLMQACLDARRFVGLEALDVAEAADLLAVQEEEVEDVASER